MKRPVVWLAIPFAAATLLLIFFPENAALPLLAAGISGAVLCCPVFRTDRRRVLLVCLAVIAACGSFLWHRQRIETLQKLDGTTASVSMTVIESRERAGGTILTLWGDLPAEKPRRGTAEIYLSDVPGWRVGDRVSGEVTFSLPREEFRLFSYGRGRFLTGVSEGFSLCEQELPQGLPVWGAVVNQRLFEAMQKAVPDENGAFLRSALLGRREELSFRDREALNRSGLGHILAVSGLHLTLICGAAVWAVRPLGKLPQFFAGTACCLAFMTVEGFTPSVTRAGIMFLLMLCALPLHRESDGITSLAAASLVMGLGNPYIWVSRGFLLSAGAVLSILLFTPVLRRAFLRWRRGRFPHAPWLDPPLRVLSASLGAAVYTYPMLSAMFGGLPVWGVPANLLSAPFTGVMLLLSAAGAASGAAGCGGAAQLLLRPACWLAALLRRIAEQISALPCSWFAISRPWQYAALAGTALLLTALALHPLPGASVRRILLSLTAAVLAGAVTCTALCREEVTLATFPDSGSLLMLQGGQAVLLDADTAGARHSCRRAKEQTVYTFPWPAEQRAILSAVEEGRPCAASMMEKTAAGILDYFPKEMTVYNGYAPLKMDEHFIIWIGKDYDLVELDRVRILKISSGYAIINCNLLPCADYLVDGEGMISRWSDESRSYEPAGRCLRLQRERKEESHASGK